MTTSTTGVWYLGDGLYLFAYAHSGDEFRRFDGCRDRRDPTTRLQNLSAGFTDAVTANFPSGASEKNDRRTFDVHGP